MCICVWSFKNTYINLQKNYIIISWVSGFVCLLSVYLTSQVSCISYLCLAFFAHFFMTACVDTHSSGLCHLRFAYCSFTLLCCFITHSPDGGHLFPNFFFSEYRCNQHLFTLICQRFNLHTRLILLFYKLIAFCV